MPETAGQNESKISAANSDATPTNQSAGVAALSALCAIARFHQVAADPATLAHQLGIASTDFVTTDDFLRAAQYLGLKAELSRSTADRLGPALAMMKAEDEHPGRLGHRGGVRVSPQCPARLRLHASKFMETQVIEFENHRAAVDQNANTGTGVLVMESPCNLWLKCRKLTQSIGLAALLLPLASCGPDIAKWKEEVLLHDGRMLVIERMVKAEAAGFPDTNRGRDLEFELKYEPLGIYWKDTKGNQQAVLEIFEGVPYLVLATGNQVGFCKGKSPKTLPIQVLKMQGKEWIEVDQETFPLDQANYNLYGSYWGNKASEDAKGLITWRHKEGEDAYPIARFEDGMAVRRPYKLREQFVANQHTCASFQ